MLARTIAIHAFLHGFRGLEISSSGQASMHKWFNVDCNSTISELAVPDTVDGRPAGNTGALVNTGVLAHYRAWPELVLSCASLAVGHSCPGFKYSRSCR
jgi:hypothetical protein